ncbi:MAG: hypothetical protein MZW92_16635 [Comamonadaceae bacterium]|nr:hypothetical protein [Comamonadaceae bacterium]
MTHPLLVRLDAIAAALAATGHAQALIGPGLGRPRDRSGSMPVRPGLLRHRRARR